MEKEEKDKQQQSASNGSTKVSRRNVLKVGLALGGATLLGDSLLGMAQGSESPIYIADLEPITGVFAAYGLSQRQGAQLAISEINAQGGILGRPMALLLGDTHSAVASAVQKAQQFIARNDVPFLMGSVSSAVSLAISPIAERHNKIFIDTGGHADPISGKDCRWSTFQVPTSTHMLAYGVAKFIAEKYGKRWFFITPNYAFGLSEQAAFEKYLKSIGGTVLGAELAPLDTTDYSAYLIKAQAAHPDALIALVAGSSLVSFMKQYLQFGLNKKFPVAGGLLDFESLVGIPQEARGGWWAIEWYWTQPGVAGVDSFVAKIKKSTGKVPTSRTRFGYVATWLLALAANEAKSLDAVKVARVLENISVPQHVGLEPYPLHFQPGYHLLNGAIYASEISQSYAYPNLVHVGKVVEGSEIMLPLDQTGCHISFPS